MIILEYLISTAAYTFHLPSTSICWPSHIKIRHIWRSFKPSCPLGDYTVKIFSSNVPVMVFISFLENFVDLLVSEMLAQFGNYLLKLMGIYFTLNNREITFFWRSNDLKTFSIWSLVWVCPSFPVARCRKASKVSPPACVTSRSWMILYTNLLLAAKPRLTKAFFS